MKTDFAQGRRRATLAVALGFAIGLGQAHAQSANPPMPPPDPSGEDAVAGDLPAELKPCPAIGADMASRGIGVLGPALVTRSEVWGPVWRADLVGPDGPAYAFRIICWRAGVMVQPMEDVPGLPPLGTAPKAGDAHDGANPDSTI